MCKILPFYADLYILVLFGGLFFVCVVVWSWYSQFKMSVEGLQAQLDALRAQNVALQAQLTPQEEHEPLPAKEICGISVKLPPFWADRPAVWFVQAEAQFHLAGIKSDMTKFSHIISIIDQKLIGEIEDIVMHPPEEDKYNTLKQELIRRLSISEQQRVERLLSEEELGNRKPSAFLRHLQSLSGNSKDDSILRQLWMRRLPSQVQAILTAQSDLSLDKLAELADKIIEVTPGPSQVYTVANKGFPDLNPLFDQLNKLSKQVAALTDERQRGRSRARSSSRSSSRRSTPTRRADTARICWYHKRYKTRAAKCIPPCAWTSGNATSSQ